MCRGCNSIVTRAVESHFDPPPSLSPPVIRELSRADPRYEDNAELISSHDSPEGEKKDGRSRGK